MRTLGVLVAAVLALGCSSSNAASDGPPTSSYDCTGKTTNDLATRAMAENICVDVRRAGRFCHVCVQSVDSSGTALTYGASESADPCGCPVPKVTSIPPSAAAP